MSSPQAPLPGPDEPPPLSDADRILRVCRRYEALAEAQGSIVWVVDPSLHSVGQSDGWERYTGQSAIAYAELGWIAAVHPEDRERLTDESGRALSTGEPIVLEFRIRRADGAWRRNLIRALPIREGDKVIEWIGTATDVEDARQAGDEQRDLRARLLALTDGADRLLAARTLAVTCEAALELAREVLPSDGYGIWMLAPELRQWRMTCGLGVSREFASQRLEGDLLTFAQPLAVTDVTASPMLTQRRDAYQAEGIRSLLTIPLPVGGVRRATLVIYHRSPHETTETELRVGVALGHLVASALWNAEAYEALERSSQAAERHASRMAFLADASARLGSLDYETTLREVAQLAVPEFTDWCAVDVIQPDDRVERLITAHVDPDKVQLVRTLEERYPTPPESTGGVAEVLRTGQPIHYPVLTDDMLVAGAVDAEHLRILRELGMHSVVIVPLTARGRTLGALTFVSASAERPLTSEDAVMLREIGRRAGIAVDNARLYREADLANAAKDEFLALLSHELRTPLNAIMGWTHMLRGGLPQEMASHAVEVIGRNARSQKQLVEDLLDVARIAGGRLDLHRTQIDLCDIVRVGVDSALPSAHAKGVTISCETPDAPMTVSADANRLQQMIANLLSNGVKFTDKGGRVLVRLRRTHEGAELAVEDTGAGIAPEFLPNVFDRFRQGDTSLTRAYGGLGLGLWIVKQIAEAHGARVHAASDGTGHGATLVVTWPLPDSASRPAS